MPLDEPTFSVTVRVTEPAEAGDRAFLAIEWEEPGAPRSYTTSTLRLRGKDDEIGNLVAALVQGYLESRASAVRRLLRRYPGGLVT